MPGQPIALAATVDIFAGLDPDDYPDGQRVVVTDDGNKQYEARGADGARVWEQLSTNRWEVLLDGSQQPVANGDGDWLYVEVKE